MGAAIREPDRSRPTVLHIDDDPQNRLLVRAILEPTGLRVIEAEDGLGGLETALRECPHLILLDIRLPDVDGYTVVGMLRTFPKLASTPVVAVTAYASEDDRQRTLVAGCDGYVEKPIDVDRFPAQVAEFLRGKRERPIHQGEPLYLRELNQRLVCRLVTQLEQSRHLNDALRQRADQLDAIHRCLQDVTCESGTVEMLDRLLPCLAAALGASQLVIELDEPPGTRLAVESAPPAAGTTDVWTDVEWKFPLTVRGEPRGFIVARYNPAPGRFPLNEHLLKIVANHVAIAVENSRLYEAERAAHAAAEAAGHRATVLAAADKVLAASLDYETTLAQVATLAVPDLADVCVVDLVDGDGRLRRLAVAGRDGIPDDLVAGLRRYPLDPATARRVADALESGQPQIVPVVTDGQLMKIARDAEHLRLLRALAPRSAIVAPLCARGRVLGVITLLSTAPDRRYYAEDVGFAQELAGRAALALDNAGLYLEVQQADRHKDLFLATLAHELRTRLAPILNAMGIVRHHEADAPLLTRAREIVERQVHHQARLLDDLLDLTRIGRGKLELRRTSVDLGALLRNVVDVLRPAIDERRQRLTLTVSEPLKLDADPVRVEQIVTNLLQNAVKYTPPEGSIALTAFRDGAMAVLSVRDTGVGIDPDALGRIFDVFVQLSTSGPRARSAGLGIGLALVRRLAELHGGSIQARSEGPGRGAEFVVRLPLADIGGERFRSPTTPAPRHILIVEDDADARESLRLALELDGHRVRVAEDGVTAVTEALADPPDVLLIDLDLPGIDGFEVARQVRQALGSRVRLIALTAHGGEDTIRRTHEAGCDHYLVKPASASEISELLARLR